MTGHNAAMKQNSCGIPLSPTMPQYTISDADMTWGYHGVHDLWISRTGRVTGHDRHQGGMLRW